MSSLIAEKIRGYIFQHYPALRARGLADHDHLTGSLDSLAVLGLVGFIEPEFSVQLSPSDMTEENFDSIDTISRLIGRLADTSPRSGSSDATALPSTAPVG